MNSRGWMVSAVLISSALFLTGCSLFSRTVVVYKCPVPVSLTNPIVVEYPEILTNEDLVLDNQNLNAALGMCNTDKATIRAIIEGVNTNDN